ncbi:MAG: DUF3107 family protein [Actinobacteria bacterium]|nr:DUF3107 family protein [Actinomycetota bacterium]
MDIRIGVSDSPREINIQLPDEADRAELRGRVDAALSGEASTLWLTDDKGKDVAIAAAKIAYVDLGPEGGTPIGFS